jgi:hypothetical protein
MSLAHHLLGLNDSDKEAAIRTLARKAAITATRKQIPGRALFLSYMRPISHALHSAGSGREELNKLQCTWRRWYHEERALLDAATTNVLTNTHNTEAL